VTEGSRIVFRAKESFATRNRKRKLQFALEAIDRLDIRSVLFVGVGAGDVYALGNYIETEIARRVPANVATGIQEEPAEGFGAFRQADGCDLPWAPDEFDLVYSNAVIEHVGGEEVQRQYLAEHARVGRYWIATTPNKTFPVESHTNTLFKHWRKDWEHPEVPRLLTKRDFTELLPPGGRVIGFVAAPTLTATNV